MTSKVKLSLVIATRNRAPSLARLLEGLAAQVNAPPFEVIIGDNGSSDDTADVIKQAQARLTIRHVREERPGKGRALNAALKLARGQLIVFTDDDVQPRPDWLAQLHAAAQAYPDCNVFGGRIDVNMKAVPNWVRRSYNLMGLLAVAYDKGDADTRYRHSEYPLGPNMAIRRQLLAGMEGPYPEFIGPGTSQPIGDESIFFWPLSPPDAKDRMYVSSACVMHHVEAENVAFWSALRRCFLAGRARGWLGVPPVVEARQNDGSTLKLIADRFRTCRSLREFACLFVRYLGYRWGRREYLEKNLPNPNSSV